MDNQKHNLLRADLLLPAAAMLALASIPILRLRFPFFDSTATVKGLVGLIELGFFFLVILTRCSSRSILSPDLQTTFKAICAVVLGWSLLIALSSTHIVVASVRLSEWIAHVLFAIAVCMWIGADHKRLLLTSYMFIAALLLYSAELYVLIFVGYIYDGQVQSGIMPGFSSIRHLGYYAAASIPISLLLMQDRAHSRGYGPFIGFLGLTLAWLIIFWAGGRGPIVALLAGAGFLLLSGARKDFVRVSPVLAASATIAFAITLKVSPPGLGMGLDRMYSAFARATNAGDFSSGRLAIWNHAWSLVMDHPWFGLGPDGYLFADRGSHSLLVQPHNSILQAALEWGIPGLLLLFVPAALGIVWLCWRWCSVPVSAPVGRSALGTYRLAMVWLVITLLAFSLVDGTLYHAQPLSMLALGVGAMFAQTLPSYPSQQRFTPSQATIGLIATTLLSAHLWSTKVGLDWETTQHQLPPVIRWMPSALTDHRLATQLIQRVEACLSDERTACETLTDFARTHLRANHRLRLNKIIEHHESMRNSAPDRAPLP